VVYEVGPGRNGRPQALHVHYIGPTAADKERAVASQGAVCSAWVIAAGFVVALAALGLLGRAPLWAPVVYVAMGFLAFAAYEDDKRKAKAGAWRTPEATLHLLGFLGGWPGALIAQRAFRHKTRKADFQGVFWATVLLHLGFWAWFAAGAPGLPK
jgi:uncharacterized membrane protein YsdA (DUF1294 family)